MPFIQAEPAMGVVMVDVHRVEQGNENIDIQKRDAHVSSRNAFTTRRSDFTLLVFGANRRTPFLNFTPSVTGRDWRVRSEITCPSVIPCR